MIQVGGLLENLAVASQIALAFPLITYPDLQKYSTLLPIATLPPVNGVDPPIIGEVGTVHSAERFAVIKSQFPYV